MADKGLNRVVEYLRRAVGPKGASTLGDAELLERFAKQGDNAAFEVIVWRHSGMVLDLCRRFLHDHHDVEDAFQATFLVLVRRARSIRKGQSISSWLYKVAYRVALRSRQMKARRTAFEGSYLKSSAPEMDAPAQTADLKLIVIEELNKLPEKYRLPVILCYLKGLTTAEAAKQLGCPQGTVHSRLSSAREQLRKRLVRRGLVLPAAGLGTLFCTSAQAAVTPIRLITTTMNTISLAQSGSALVGGLVPQVISLAEGVLTTMFVIKLRLIGTALFVLCSLGVAGGRLAPVVLGDKPNPNPQPALVQGQKDTIELPQSTYQVLGLKV